MGGGGLYSTAGDYLKFVRMMLNQGKSDGGQAVLKPETVALMSKNAMGDFEGHPAQDRGAAVLQRRRVLPRAGEAVGPLLHDQQHRSADRPLGRRARLGRTCANTYYWIDQKKGVGGVYATQILPFADAKALPLFYAFETAVYGK